MKSKIRIILLEIYDLLLASGAICMGIQMMQSESGIFAEYPKEWLSKLPFTGWFIPGILTVIIFGLGNLFAAVMAFLNKDKAWIASGIMGLILLLSLAAQIGILGECYLATVEFIILSFIQLALSVNVYLHFKSA